MHVFICIILSSIYFTADAIGFLSGGKEEGIDIHRYLNYGKLDIFRISQEISGRQKCHI